MVFGLALSPGCISFFGEPSRTGPKNLLGNQSGRKSTCKEENCHPFWLMMAFFTFSPFLNLPFAGPKNLKTFKTFKIIAVKTFKMML